MISLTGIGNRCQDVVFLKEVVILKNLFVRRPCGQQIEDITNANAISSDARLAAAFAGFDRNAVEQFVTHNFILAAINVWRLIVAIACVARETSGST